MQLHTVLFGVRDDMMQFCVFTGSGSPSDEWHHETDSKGNKVVRVEFEISRMNPSNFNEAIKAAEQKATEEYHKHCALYGPMSVDITGAFTNKKGVTIPLNNAEVKMALGQYMPTEAENKAAEDFFKRHGVRPYVKNSARERLDAEVMQELMAHDQEIDKAVSKIAAAYPRAFGIVKQPLTPEQKADMDKYYEILAQQAKEAVCVILSVDNLSQLGLPKKSENATDAKQRLDAIADKNFTLTGRLLADAKTNPQYGLLNKPVSYDKNAKLPTSDPVALDAMIEKRTKMAEALRKQGEATGQTMAEMLGVDDGRLGHRPLLDPDTEALKERVRAAKRSYDAALDKKAMTATC